MSSEWLAAARSGDAFTLKKLYSAADSDSARAALCSARSTGVSASGHTAFHWAAAGGHEACLRWLLALPGAANHASAANHGGSTPLHSAAANGHASCVAALLAAGLDPVAVDSTGDQPFACAASRAHEAAARALAPRAPPHAFLLLSIGGRRVGRAR